LQRISPLLERRRPPKLVALVIRAKRKTTAPCLRTTRAHNPIVGSHSRALIQVKIHSPDERALLKTAKRRPKWENRRLCLVAPDVPISWTASCGLSKPRGCEASRMAFHFVPLAQRGRPVRPTKNSARAQSRSSLKTRWIRCRDLAVCPLIINAVRVACSGHTTSGGDDG